MPTNKTAINHQPSPTTSKSQYFRPILTSFYFQFFVSFFFFKILGSCEVDQKGIGDSSIICSAEQIIQLQ
jgi:hypothetical protein